MLAYITGRRNAETRTLKGHTNICMVQTFPKSFDTNNRRVEEVEAGWPPAVERGSAAGFEFQHALDCAQSAGKELPLRG